MPIFSFILLTISEKKNFEYFFWKIYPLCRPVNQSKAIWTKVVCNMEDYSINISVGKKSNISSEHVCQVSASSPLWFLRRRFLNSFTKIDPFLPRRQPIKFTDLDKSRMKRRGLLNKHFCKKIQISPMRQKKLSISSFPIISLWEL